jgi:hypothetical protein
MATFYVHLKFPVKHVMYFLTVQRKSVFVSTAPVPISPSSLAAVFLSFSLQGPAGPQANVSLKNHKFTFHHPSDFRSQKYFVIT